jgi:uncharacterized membrane protein
VSDVCGVKRMVYGLLSSYNYTLTKRKLGVITFFFFLSFFTSVLIVLFCFLMWFVKSPQELDQTLEVNAQ